MPHRFLRLPEVKQRVGLSRSSIYLRAAQGRFPKPISLGEHSVAWLEKDIDRWMAERMAARADDPIDTVPEPPAQASKAAADDLELGANTRAGFSPRASKRGFVAERPATSALIGTRDGRR